MAHYAFLNEDNLVVEVIVGIDEKELIEGLDPETWYENFRGLTCKRTSYNGKIRKNYAGAGFVFDHDRDAFIPPQPFNSWQLNEDTCRWEAPVSYPEDGFTYSWNEQELDWQIVDFSEPDQELES